MTRKGERDYLMGVNTNGPSFGGITGFQWGFSSETEIDGKRPTKGAPMCIGTAPVGLSAINDKIWKKTYGASLDSFLSLINGSKLQENIDSIESDEYEELSGVSRFPNASNMNIYKRAVVEGKEYQQIQYVVSKDTVREASAAVGFYGDVDETRGIGIRMPSIVGGWGVGTDLLPTDPSPELENFSVNSDAHKLDRATWKYGPLDLRWDDRRGVWAAYNDMIVDHDYNGRWDTFVFGTSKAEPGFPYLRAGWSDAFWVRYTGRGTDPSSLKFIQLAITKSHSYKTAELLTHTNHKWFDPFTNCAAAIGTAFIVNHWDFEYVVGDDITRTGGSIDISTSVHFSARGFPSQTPASYDGPLAFNINPKGTCSFIGDLVWVDSPIPPNGTRYGETSADRPKGYWAPRIVLGSPCQLVSGPITALVNNDARIGTRLVNLCNTVVEYTKDMKDILDEYAGFYGGMMIHSTLLQLRDEEYATAVADYAAQLRNDCIVDDSRVVRRIVNAVNLAFQQLAASLLENCGCTINVPVVEVDPFDVWIQPFTPNILLEDINAPYIEVPELDCDEQCYPIELDGPCTKRSNGFSVGIPCVQDISSYIEPAVRGC